MLPIGLVRARVDHHHFAVADKQRAVRVADVQEDGIEGGGCGINKDAYNDKEGYNSSFKHGFTPL